MLVTSYMRKDAQTWVKSYLIKFLSKESDNATNRIFTKYLKFKEKL
jgi:hypothetical protein